jgi:predicted nucleic acid-binding protein
VISHVVGDHPEHASGIAGLFHDSDTGRVQLFGSTLLLVEVLGGGFNAPVDPEMENRILRLLRDPATMTLIPSSVQVGMLARELRSEFRLEAPDAIHLASAVFVGVDLFMTLDADDFPIGREVRGVRIELPRLPSGTSSCRNDRTEPDDHCSGPTPESLVRGPCLTG